MRRWFLLLLLLLPLTFGFRTLPGVNGWAISTNDPTLWVRSCSRPTFTSNEIAGGDPLSGAVPTYDQALQSIMDDYNSVPGSFLRLAPYPADPANPGSPAAGDSTFTLAAAAERTIDICLNNQTFTAGHASPNANDDGRITGCAIRLDSGAMREAGDFVEVLTHEIGHCIGLAHPQETEHAIMSYFSEGLRLQMDDRMGLVHLYPQEVTYGNETATFGLSCATR